MADPFVAEIRIMPFNFAPKGWAWCDGQLLPLSQNTALFSLLGTTYGGNGKSNFALPDLRDRAPMYAGDGPGLTPRSLGEQVGAETVQLTAAALPNHSHTGLNATSAFATQESPVGVLPAAGATIYGDGAAAASAAPVAAVPHENRQPYLTCYFSIALQGVFPPRT